MTRDLGLEIHAWLSEHPDGARVEEIARGVCAATQPVRETLRGDSRFSGPWKHGSGSRVTHLWRARAVKADGQRRPRVTQGAQLLDLLADGRWHTTASILRVVPCILHSRVAEIDKRGQHRIEHRGAGGGAENHSYRLVTLEEAESSSSSVSSSGVGSSSAACDQTAAPSLGDPWPAPLDLQLTLEVAA